MLNFNAASVRYEPYPLLVLRPALESKLYQDLCNSYPDTFLFGKVPGYDYKLSLSEKFAADNYHRFLQSNEPWRRFHHWLKSDDFIRQTVEFLKSQNIDLGLDEAFRSSSGRLARAAEALLRGKLPRRDLRLRSRFEFSVLKADGGEVAPHTDTPKKVITLVLSMIRDGEWEQNYGGGLDINTSKDPTFAFNWNNRIVPWDKIAVVDTVPFVANQCVIFVKTFNSLHSVRKMKQAGSQALRKTITIVIEKDE